MSERDMENLVWQHPEKFFDEPLTRFERQPTIRVGRADLVFVDQSGALLVMELKQGFLNRKVIAQLVDYESHYRMHYPNRNTRMMAVANKILPERQQGLNRLGFEWREISEATLQRIAQEVGYPLPPSQSNLAPVAGSEGSPNVQSIRAETPFGRSREYAVGPCGNVGHLPPTPDREARLNPFDSGSFLSDVFDVARTGISKPEIDALAQKHGQGSLSFALENLSKGVRRNKGVRNLTGHYGLVWDVHLTRVPLPINGTLGNLGPIDVVSVGNVRRAMAECA